MPPVEGQPLQLTIDYDLQKAVEDGFKAAAEAFNGAALISIRAPAKCWRSPASLRTIPNAFASGIDRATWASLNTDERCGR